MERRGYTLVELLVTITIIGILSMIGIASFLSSQQKSRDARRKADLKAIAKALEMYINDKGQYPFSSLGKMLGCNGGPCEWGSSFTDGTTVYLQKLPTDTTNNYAYYYEFIEPNGYRLYARLENSTDPNGLTQFDTTCSTTGSKCNYMVESENVSSGLANGSSGEANPPSSYNLHAPNPTPPPTCTASCLLGYWNMDESENGSCSSGYDVCDVSGNAKHGTSNGVGIAAGKFGNARQFAGTGSFIALRATPFSGSHPNIAFSFWIKRLSGLSSDYVFGSGTNNAPYPSDYGIRITTDGKIHYTFHSEEGGVGKFVETNATGLVPVGVWTHIYLALTSDTNGSIYVNGAQKAATVSCAGAGCGSYHAEMPVSIGRFGARDSTGFTGLLDEFRVYYKNLTDAEIRQCAGL